MINFQVNSINFQDRRLNQDFNLKNKPSFKSELKIHNKQIIKTASRTKF